MATNVFFSGSGVALLVVAGITLMGGIVCAVLADYGMREQPVGIGMDGGQPDLVLDIDTLQQSIQFQDTFFTEDSCAYLEQCVGGTGLRRLMKFSTETANLGTADLILGDPESSENFGLFEYDSCHQHFHYNGYASYELLDSQGNMVVNGRKAAFCLIDISRVTEFANPERVYSCSYQGIQRGWSDVYDSSLDCQWIDITGLAAGNYTLRVEVNPLRNIAELDYENNLHFLPIEIPTNEVFEQQNASFPVADLGADYTGVTGEPVTLDASMSSNPTSNTSLTFTFIFGDATPPMVTTSATVSHTYEFAGQYTASVRVNNGIFQSLPDISMVTISGDEIPMARNVAPRTEPRYETSTVVVLWILFGLCTVTALCTFAFSFFVLKWKK